MLLHNRQWEAVTQSHCRTTHCLAYFHTCARLVGAFDLRCGEARVRMLQRISDHSIASVEYKRVVTMERTTLVSPLLPRLCW